MLGPSVRVACRGRRRAAIAVVGVPGGLAIDDAVLRQLQRDGEIGSWEWRGASRLVLRWPHGRDERRVALAARAAIPGTYMGPASRARLVGEHAAPAWAGGLRVDVESLDPP